MENAKNVLFTNLNASLPTISHGKGCTLYDTDGRAYLDCAAGIAVVNIGHGVPEIAKAMAKQAEAVTFVYGGTFTSRPRNRLAEQIAALAPEGFQKVFLCSGGSEAMESLLKIARQYHLERGDAGRFKVISRWQSYHGNTIATLAMGGRPSWRQKYTPYFGNAYPHIAPCNCYRCPFSLSYPSCGVACAKELERVIRYEGAESVSAFVLEPVVGTTAAAMAPPPEYLPMVRDICDRYGVLLCTDEVITAFGRTGKNFAVDHYNVTPDLIGFAKGLGSGYASIGGVLVHSKVSDAIAGGSGILTHSFTFSGMPISCAVGSAVLDYMEEHSLVERARVMGALFLETLTGLLDIPIVGDVRGLGLMLGVEFVRDKKTKEPLPNGFSAKVAAKCFQNGVIVTAGIPGSADGVIGEAIQIAPPLVIGEAEIERAVAVLREAILDAADELC